MGLLDLTDILKAFFPPQPSCAALCSHKTSSLTGMTSCSSDLKGWPLLGGLPVIGNELSMVDWWTSMVWKKRGWLIQASYSKSTMIPGWSTSTYHGSKTLDVGKRTYGWCIATCKKKDIPLKEWSSKYCSIFWVDYYKKKKQKHTPDIQHRNQKSAIQFDFFPSNKHPWTGFPMGLPCSIFTAFTMSSYHPVSPDFLGKIDGWLITQKKL